MTLQSFVLFYLPFVVAAGAIAVSFIYGFRHRRQLRIEDESAKLRVK